MTTRSPDGDDSVEVDVSRAAPDSSGRGAAGRLFGRPSHGSAPRSSSSSLAKPSNLNTFEKHAYLAHLEISANALTRGAYWSDFRRWLEFVAERGFDPANPPRAAVVAFREWMRLGGDSSKTRERRMSALSSIYGRLYRPGENGEPPVATRNPFSVADGPAREPAIPIRPTPVADVDLVRRVLDSCGSDDLGIRDAAILRVLWATGMRRVSLLSMTHERLQREHATGAFVATVVGKRSKQQRVLIRGRAATALAAWLAILTAAKISSGAIWLAKCGSMTPRDLHYVFERRLRKIGAPRRSLSAHMLRASFLTYNPAPLDARQDAVAHSDPRTTASYDRASWRGRAAFELMPEVEQLAPSDEPSPSRVSGGPSPRR